MTRDDLCNEYFCWMYDLVCSDRRFRKISYGKLLSHLYDVDFDYTLYMDGNRAADGVDLRYRFGREHGHPDSAVACYLDDRRCSVLEMLVALSIRCEDHIMCDPDIGNRTGSWFWEMLTNLGLDRMDDSSYDSKYVDEKINIFLNREYKPDGTGGLFVVKNPRCDLRTVDIWYQMNWYLAEKHY